MIDGRYWFGFVSVVEKPFVFVFSPTAKYEFVLSTMVFVENGIANDPSLICSRFSVRIRTYVYHCVRSNFTFKFWTLLGHRFRIHITVRYTIHWYIYMVIEKYQFMNQWFGDLKFKKKKKSIVNASTPLHCLIKGNVDVSSAVKEECNITFCFTNRRNCFEKYHG